jgi:uncharacterized protein
MSSSSDFMEAVPGVPGGIVLRVKAVPGASRTRIAGVLGDRLKVQVAAPAEGGKANDALCKLMAETLGVPLRQVTVIAGHTQARKTLSIAGMTIAGAAARLGLESTTQGSGRSRTTLGTDENGTRNA